MSATEIAPTMIPSRMNATALRHHSASTSGAAGWPGAVVAVGGPNAPGGTGPVP
jgi:hypothetical protein